MTDSARIALVFLIVDYVAGTYLVVLAYRHYPDHSFGAWSTWLIMYFFAVVQPIYITLLHLRWLKARGVELTRAGRFYLVSPIVAGGLTLLYALDLIHRVVR